MHDYPYTIDEITIQEMKNLDVAGWCEILEKIIQKAPIPLNISFTERDPEVMIKELYSATLKYNKASIGNIQASVVAVLQSYYGVNSLIEETYFLIKNIDFIKPVKYFNQLSLLFRLTYENNPSYLNATCRGENIHHIFFDGLSTFDNNSELLYFFWSKRNIETEVSYYLAIFRYVVSTRKELLNNFFEELMPILSNEEIKEIILDVFKEEVFYTRSFLFLLNWVSFFPKQNDEAFLKFRNYLYVNWINLDLYKQKYKDYFCYDIIQHLFSSNEHEVDEWAAIFQLIAKNEEINQEQKNAISLNFFQRASLRYMSDYDIDYDFTPLVKYSLSEAHQSSILDAIGYAWRKISEVKENIETLRSKI